MVSYRFFFSAPSLETLKSTLLYYWLMSNRNFKMVTAPLKLVLWVNGIMVAASRMNVS